MRSNDPNAVEIAAKLHAGTGITAESIAATVYDRSRKGKHYILAGTRFSDRTIWKLKRYFPSVYLNMMKSNARIQLADKNLSTERGGIFERVLRSIRARVLR
jgi:hypothetical protein